MGLELHNTESAEPGNGQSRAKLRTLLTALGLVAAPAITLTPLDSATAQVDTIKKEAFNRGQHYLDQAVLPIKIQNHEELAELYKTLQTINFPLSELAGEAQDMKDARLRATVFRAKLVYVGALIREYQKKPTAREDLQLSGDVIRLLDDLVRDIDIFTRDGRGVYQQLKANPLKAGLDPHNKRNEYRKFNLSEYNLDKLIEAGITTREIQSYYDSGVLEACFRCLELKIPLWIVRNFLDLFSDQEKLMHRNAITNDSIINVLAATVSFSDARRRGVLKRLALFITLGVEMYDRHHKIEPETILRALVLSDSSLDMEGLHRLGLSGADIAYLSSTKLSRKEIEDGVKQYGDSLSAHDIVFAHRRGILLKDLQRVYDFAKAPVKGDIETILMMPQAKPELVLQYLEFLSPEQRPYILHYFIKHNVPVSEVKEYLSLGVPSPIEVQALKEASVPLSFVRELKTANVISLPYDSHNIVGSYKLYLEGTSLSDMRDIRERAIQNGMPKAMSTWRIVREWKRLEENPERARLFQQLVAFGFDSFEVVINIFKMPLHLSDEKLKMLKELHVGLESAQFLEDDVVFGVLKALSIEAPSRGFYGNDVADIAQLSRGGVSTGELVAMYREGFNFGYAKLLREYGQNWRDYLPYMNLSIDYEGQRLLKLFKIDARRAAIYLPKGRYTDSRAVSEIIRKESAAGKLAPDAQNFLDRFALSYPEHVPIEILEAMKDGYSSPERKDKPIAVIVTAKNDWNTALESGEIYRKLLPFYNVFMYEAGAKQDLKKSTRDALLSASQGKGVSLLVLGGHGSEREINLSQIDAPQSHLSMNDQSLFQDIQRDLAPDAQVVLRSCSTGRGGLGNNIATKISEWLGSRAVHAPEEPTNIKSFNLDGHGRLSAVDYFGGVKTHIIRAPSRASPLP